MNSFLIYENNSSKAAQDRNLWLVSQDWYRYHSTVVALYKLYIRCVYLIYDL